MRRRRASTTTSSPHRPKSVLGGKRGRWPSPKCSESGSRVSKKARVVTRIDMVKRREVGSGTSHRSMFAERRSTKSRASRGLGRSRAIGSRTMTMSFRAPVLRRGRATYETFTTFDTPRARPSGGLHHTIRMLWVTRERYSSNRSSRCSRYRKAGRTPRPGPDTSDGGRAGDGGGGALSCGPTPTAHSVRA